MVAVGVVSVPLSARLYRVKAAVSLAFSGLWMFTTPFCIMAANTPTEPMDTTAQASTAARAFTRNLPPFFFLGAGFGCW